MYQRRDSTPLHGIPRGKYAIVFLRYRDWPYFDTVNVEDGKVVSINFSFLELPKDPAWLLSPRD